MSEAELYEIERAGAELILPLPMPLAKIWGWIRLALPLVSGLPSPLGGVGDGVVGYEIPLCRPNLKAKHS